MALLTNIGKVTKILSTQLCIWNHLCISHVSEKLAVQSSTQQFCSGNFGVDCVCNQNLQFTPNVLKIWYVTHFLCLVVNKFFFIYQNKQAMQENSEVLHNVSMESCTNLSSSKGNIWSRASQLIGCLHMWSFTWIGTDKILFLVRPRRNNHSC